MAYVRCIGSGSTFLPGASSAAPHRYDARARTTWCLVCRRTLRAQPHMHASGWFMVPQHKAAPTSNRSGVL